MQLVFGGNTEVSQGKHWDRFRAARNNTPHGSQHVLDGHPRESRTFCPSPLIYLFAVNVFYRDVLPIWFEMRFEILVGNRKRRFPKKIGCELFPIILHTISEGFR